MSERLTVTALAERAGVHKSTVSRQVRAWGLVGADGLIEVEAYVAKRQELDPALQRTAKPEKAPGYASHKARNEAAKAELAELQLAERRGALILRSDVAPLIGGWSRQLRDELLAIPRDTVPDPVAAADCEAAINAAITRFADRVMAMSLERNPNAGDAEPPASG